MPVLKLAIKEGTILPFFFRRSKIREYMEAHFTPHIKQSFPIKQDKMINVFK